MKRSYNGMETPQTWENQIEESKAFSLSGSSTICHTKSTRIHCFYKIKESSPKSKLTQYFLHGKLQYDCHAQLTSCFSRHIVPTHDGTINYERKIPCKSHLASLQANTINEIWSMSVAGRRIQCVAYNAEKIFFYYICSLCWTAHLCWLSLILRLWASCGDHHCSVVRSFIYIVLDSHPK